MAAEQATDMRAYGSGELEVKDALLIFNSVWTEVENERGRENMNFPREIFWINGAPGAGKGTHTRIAMDLRDLTEAPIVMSGLLDSPEARALIDKGMLVGDREVVAILFRRLLDPRYQSGACVDGFPRTMVQVECLKLLQNRMMELYSEFRETLFALRFRKPQFHILVLFVDEAESIKRQIERGRKAIQHNEEVRQTGIGEPVEIRKTDTDPDAARRRYRVFKEHTYEALKTLRQLFHFHFVNTHGTIAEARERIIEELRYQSSLELEQETFDCVSSVPLATEIARHARQELVERLDGYVRQNNDLFQRVLEIIRTKFIPIIRRHAISGHAVVRSDDLIFDEPQAIAMLIDIFSERGYNAVVDVRRDEIPESIDPRTFKLTTRQRKYLRVTISFLGSTLRRGESV